MKILFVPDGGWQKASSRLRVYELLSYLEDKGIDCDVLPATGLNKTHYKAVFVSRLLAAAPFYDAIYVQKVRFPPYFTKVLSPLSEKLIFDFDDAIYTTPPSQSSGEGHTKSLNTLLTDSDLTIAGSHTLADYARDYTENVRTIETGIPKEKYEPSNGTIDEDNITFGWIGHPDNLHYLKDVESELSEVLEKHDQTKLRIITAGEFPVKPFADRVGADVTYAEWTLATAIDELSKVDVGIRPLWDDEWTQAKGGFTSVIECMALRIPVVVSPVGIIPDIIDEGTNGFSPVTGEDWIVALEYFVSNPNNIKPMGDEARATVSEMGFWSSDKAEELYSCLTSVRHQ